MTSVVKKKKRSSNEAGEDLPLPSTSYVKDYMLLQNYVKRSVFFFTEPC